MNVIDLELEKGKIALNDWVKKCEKKILTRHPLINFHSDEWQIGITSYGDPLTKKTTSTSPNCNRIGFKSSIKKFKNKDESFILCLRCLACLFLEKNNHYFNSYSIAFDFLSRLPINNIYELKETHIRTIETDILEICKLHPNKVESHTRHLRLLESFIIPHLSAVGVAPHVFYSQDPALKYEFKVILNKYQNIKTNRRKNSDDRNARIAATSDAIRASFSNDKRLSNFDHLVCCALVVLFTAPSRINEPLFMNIDDVISIDSYRERGKGEMASLYVAQNHLFIAMKGSKGSDWGPKPALNFMHELLLLAVERIKELGKRSRFLLNYYENNPNILYLPPELQYLRNKDFWGYEDITRIVRLDGITEYKNLTTPHALIIKLISSEPKGIKKIILHGQESSLIPRAFVEQYLLSLVKEAIKKCRIEDRQIYYGKLSKRLFLCDVAPNQLQFLPNALRYSTLSRRLTVRNGPKSVTTGSIFTKLNLKVPSGNEIIDAYITTHEVRHFLTDSAAKFGENLSDTLINQWARRLDIKQLEHYIQDSPHLDANRSRMPIVKEFIEISEAIERTNMINDDWNIATKLIKVSDTAVLATQIDAVVNAIEERPIARVSNKIILLYPSEFGICLHQHHESPCQNYGIECLGCYDNITVKGHIPTNDAVREESKKLQRSVLRQLEKLVIEYNRGIADNQSCFAEHIVKLVKGTLNVEALTDSLIDEFEEIKDLIKDKNLRRRVEQAFVAKKTVEFLDDTKTLIGGVIRYHNPDRNGNQGIDKAELTFGGWNKHWSEEKNLEKKFPFLIHTRVTNIKDMSDQLNEDLE